MNIIIILTVASIIVAVTNIGKKLVNYIVNVVRKIKGKQDKTTVSVGLPIAIGLGILSGIGLQMGMTASILEIFGTQFQASELFIKTDIGFTCALLSAGSGAILKLVEKNQEDRAQLAELIAKDK